MGPIPIENMNQKSCVTEELEHRMKACHLFVFFLLILIMFAIVIIQPSDTLHT